MYIYKKLTIVLMVLFSSFVFASREAVQSAQCPAEIGGGGYACCNNDNWSSPLWVFTNKAVDSSQAIRSVCWSVNADFNAWEGECGYATSIFNQQSSTRINTECEIHNYKPFAEDATAEEMKKRN
ncbi:hypothetical protein [Marinicella sp. W31]|uniref:hypothetical protein n=1 Tax=Marinicella sp. W31 TaxID=3023713 RepID=UPI0037574189